MTFPKDLEEPRIFIKRSSDSKKGKIPWNKGIPHTEETKRKISEKNKGRKPSLETRLKMSKSQKGRPPTKGKTGQSVSEETRNKISKSLKGRVLSEEHKRRISESKKNPSMETRNKISKSKLGKPNFSQKGKPKSLETKKKLSESRFKFFKNPKNKEKIERMLGSYKRCKKGIHYSEKAKNGEITWIGTFEFRYYKILDLDPTVLMYRHPDPIPYIFSNKKHLYFPDLIIYYSDGGWEVKEIKPEYMLTDAVVLAKKEEAIKVFGKEKYSFITEKDLSELEEKHEYR